MMESTDVTTEMVRDGLEAGLLYVAEHVNLDSEKEARLVTLLKQVRDAGSKGLGLLDQVIAAIQKRTASDVA